jgi:hypothetical protein
MGANSVRRLSVLAGPFCPQAHCAPDQRTLARAHADTTRRRQNRSWNMRALGQARPSASFSSLFLEMEKGHWALSFSDCCARRPHVRLLRGGRVGCACAQPGRLSRAKATEATTRAKESTFPQEKKREGRLCADRACARPRSQQKKNEKLERTLDEVVAKNYAAEADLGNNNSPGRLPL